MSCLCVKERLWKGKLMVSARVVPIMKYGGGDMIVWGCFAGNTVIDLFKTKGPFNQHHCHNILQQNAVLSGFHLVGPLFVFQQDSDPKHASSLSKVYLPKKESEGVLHHMTWPPESPDLSSSRWVGMSWTEKRKAANKCLTYMGTHSRLLEKHSRSPPHKAGWENAKSMHSCHQSNRWQLFFFEESKI